MVIFPSNRLFPNLNWTICLTHFVWVQRPAICPSWKFYNWTADSKKMIQFGALKSITHFPQDTFSLDSNSPTEKGYSFIKNISLHL